LANLSPGFERSENPGNTYKNKQQTLQGFGNWRTLAGFIRYAKWFPRVVRFAPNPGLELANAFGVNWPNLR